MLAIDAPSGILPGSLRGRGHDPRPQPRRRRSRHFAAHPSSALAGSAANRRTATTRPTNRWWKDRVQPPGGRRHRRRSSARRHSQQQATSTVLPQRAAPIAIMTETNAISQDRAGNAAASGWTGCRYGARRWRCCHRAGEHGRTPATAPTRLTWPTTRQGRSSAGPLCSWTSRPRRQHHHWRCCPGCSCAGDLWPYPGR